VLLLLHSLGQMAASITLKISNVHRGLEVHSQRIFRSFFEFKDPIQPTAADKKPSLLPYPSLSSIFLFHPIRWESAVDSLSISRTFRPSYWRAGMPKAISVEYSISSGAAGVLGLCWCQPLLNSRNRGYSSGIIPPTRQSQEPIEICLNIGYIVHAELIE
jgi:hypothetical protein